MDFFSQIGQNISAFFSEYGWKIVLTLGCIVIGYFVIKGLVWAVRQILYRTKLDNAVVTFVA